MNEELTKTIVAQAAEIAELRGALKRKEENYDYAVKAIVELKSEIQELKNRLVKYVSGT